MTRNHHQLGFAKITFPVNSGSTTSQIRQIPIYQIISISQIDQIAELGLIRTISCTIAPSTPD